VINATNLRKRYGNIEALNGISFTIREGELYGLLGPNGAGKSTTINIISSLLEPDQGTVTINGLDLNTNKDLCKRMIGVVPQEIALYDQLSAMDNLLFWGGLYEKKTSVLRKRIDETLHQFGLYERRKDKIKTYSGGMKRRINIASALRHQPKILFMDEPTVGIDPQSRNNIFEVIEKLHRDGMTIIYTTHYMEEAQRLCDRIGIIDQGIIVAQGTLDELRSASQMKESIILAFEKTEETALKSLAAISANAVISDHTITFPSENVKQDLSKLIFKCTELGLIPSHIEIEKVNLESIFLKLTGKQLRD